VVAVGDRLTSGWTTSPDGHLEGVDNELRTHVIGDRPAHDPAAEGVEDHGQVRLAVLGWVLGDVHHPQAVGLGGVEGPIHQVLARLGSEIAPACAAADVLAETQLGMDPRGTIGAPAHGPDVDDGVAEIGVVEILEAAPGWPARHRTPEVDTLITRQQAATGRSAQARAMKV
jgi:hypothetical protein